MPVPPPPDSPFGPHDDDSEIAEGLRLLRDRHPEARNTLLACASRRFQHRASQMLDRFPRLRRFEQTGDVLQKALIRLDAALAQCSPDTPRHFCNLVARQIRRELLDLVRHYFGPLGMGTNQDGGGLPDDDVAGAATGDEDGPQTLAEWTEFHERVGGLDADAQEIMELHWYQGLTLQQIAELQGATHAAVRSQWRKARESIGSWIRPAAPGEGRAG